MNVVLPIPDDLTERLGGGDAVARQALEAWAAEAYRDGRLSSAELRDLLGFGTRYEMDGFLKARGIYEDEPLDELRQQQRDLDQLGY
jgi:Uncharacterised protein family (UPF0175)